MDFVVVPAMIMEGVHLFVDVRTGGGCISIGVSWSKCVMIMPHFKAGYSQKPEMSDMMVI